MQAQPLTFMIEIPAQLMSRSLEPLIWLVTFKASEATEIEKPKKLMTGRVKAPVLGPLLAHLCYDGNQMCSVLLSESPLKTSILDNWKACTALKVIVDYQCNCTFICESYYILRPEFARLSQFARFKPTIEHLSVVKEV